MIPPPHIAAGEAVTTVAGSESAQQSEQNITKQNTALREP
jgi:hypothetical protein